MFFRLEIRTVSPKYCSLAYDEKQDHETLVDSGYEPQLQLYVSGRNKIGSFLSALAELEEIVQIQGRITVSF